MAGGGYIDAGDVNDVNGRVTASVILTCIVAASGGLIFGYDIGISGGVTTMVPFLRKFFPSVLRKMAAATRNQYCVYDSQILTLFTSSLYLAALVSSLLAGRVTVAKGRKATMVLGGFIFLIGTVVGATAVNVEMLIAGRVLLGFGIGFTNQATPVYLAEMAPPRWRGAFNTGFQFFIGVGVLTANLINVWVAGLGVDWCWRLALGLAGVPALIMTLGAIFVSDTPISLVQRGMVHQARQSLSQVRGVDSDVESELNDLVNQNNVAKAATEGQFKKIFQRHYRPHLVSTSAVQIFQQLTGINIIAFFAPVLLQSIGFGSKSALIGAVLLGVINLGSILVSTFIVDRCGRRRLFLVGGIVMIVCQVALACLLGIKIGASGTEPLSRNDSILVLLLMCIFTSSFGFSWGPLSFLVPSEVLPMEVRPAGNSIGVAINFVITFVLAQTFLTMLCHFKYGTFLFYTAWVMVMTVFVMMFLPETKGIPLESMHPVWEQHWYWHRFVHRRSPKDLPMRPMS